MYYMNYTVQSKSTAQNVMFTFNVIASVLHISAQNKYLCNTVLQHDIFFYLFWKRTCIFLTDRRYKRVAN